MEIKQFRKGASINEVYAEMHKQKALAERYFKRMDTDPSRETFEKYKAAKNALTWYENIIAKYKRITKGRPWEEVRHAKD